MVQALEGVSWVISTEWRAKWQYLVFSFVLANMTFFCLFVSLAIMSTNGDSFHSENESVIFKSHKNLEQSIWRNGMTNGTEISRKFQIFGKKDNRLSIYLILYRKFRLNRLRSLNLENMSGSNFDWSMKTMVPWRSWQKWHEGTPGTNLFACWQLAADHPCQGTFVTQRAVRTLKVSMAFLPRFFRMSETSWREKNLSSQRDTASVKSELRWQDRYTSLLWFYEGIGTLGMISTDLFHFVLRAWLK